MNDSRPITFFSFVSICLEEHLVYSATELRRWLSALAEKSGRGRAIFGFVRVSLFTVWIHYDIKRADVIAFREFGI
tara:strand:- start:174 stop:401 length:228 start_codon:yes stop_codon:yes gene_type:complete